MTCVAVRGPGPSSATMRWSACDRVTGPGLSGGPERFAETAVEKSILPAYGPRSGRRATVTALSHSRNGRGTGTPHRTRARALTDTRAAPSATAQRHAR